MVEKDFSFLGIEIKEDDIKLYTKVEYRKKINKLVKKAAFSEYIKEKEQKSKLNNLTYETLNIQPYLTKCGFTKKEISLLYSLRSRSHPAKCNYKKMYNYRLQCSFGCLTDESQCHIFEQCKPVREKLELKETYRINYIYGDLSKHKAAVSNYIQIEENRVKMKLLLKENIPPGEAARTRADKAPDIISS